MYVLTLWQRILNNGSGIMYVQTYTKAEYIFTISAHQLQHTINYEY